MAGGQFWGCSLYPRCTGTRDMAISDEEVVGGSGPSHSLRAERRVSWYDGSLRRPGWKARYVSLGGGLRSVSLPGSTRRPTTCWLARQDLASYKPLDAETHRVVGMMLKLLGSRHDATTSSR